MYDPELLADATDSVGDALGWTRWMVAAQCLVSTNPLTVRFEYTHGRTVDAVRPWRVVGDWLHRDVDGATCQNRTETLHSLSMLRGACGRVIGGGGLSMRDLRICLEYERSPLIRPTCTNRTPVVPLIYHSVDRQRPPPYIVRANAGGNPEYTLNYHNDSSAEAFVRRHCPLEVYQAYRCLRAPAYRGDVFRFCALYSMGGVYLDSDLALLVPLSEVYSPCSSATLGYDFPWGGRRGKQMKILAGRRRAPVFECMLRTIVHHVRSRYTPPDTLGITGPTVLDQCYTKNSTDVAITYIDSKMAHVSLSGMRQGNRILAYESPSERDREAVDAHHYSQQRSVYRDDCALHVKFLGVYCKCRSKRTSRADSDQRQAIRGAIVPHSVPSKQAISKREHGDDKLFLKCRDAQHVRDSSPNGYKRSRTTAIITMY